MKKVLVFGLTDNNGGVENFIINFYRNINCDNVHFDFLVYDNKPCYYEEISEKGSKVYIVPSRKTSVIKNKKSLNNFFQKNAKDYDCIWCNLCSLSDIMPIKYAYKYGIKKRIIHSHSSKNMGSKITATLHKVHKKVYSKYATDFFSCSLLASKWMFNDEDISSDKHKIIKNAIDTNKFKFDLEVRNKIREEFGIVDKLVIGHVGRFDYAKNHDFLIDVFSEIQKRVPSAILLSIGDGENFEQIKDKIEELNLQGNVLLLGKRYDVYNLYQAMDLFLFPSRFEGFPVACVEAQVSGLPCIISDTITNEIKITDNCKFVSLEASKKIWCDTIMNETSNLDVNNRDNYYKSTSRSGYNIKVEAENLENLL